MDIKKKKCFIVVEKNELLLINMIMLCIDVLNNIICSEARVSAQNSARSGCMDRTRVKLYKTK